MGVMLWCSVFCFVRRPLVSFGEKCKGWLGPGALCLKQAALVARAKYGYLPPFDISVLRKTTGFCVCVCRIAFVWEYSSSTLPHKGLRGKWGNNPTAIDI